MLPVGPRELTGMTRGDMINCFFVWQGFHTLLLTSIFSWYMSSSLGEFRVRLLNISNGNYIH